MLKDTEISRLFGIPVQTLAVWKKKDAKNWRRTIYLYLLNSEGNIVKEEIERINSKEDDNIYSKVYSTIQERLKELEKKVKLIESK